MAQSKKLMSDMEKKAKLSVLKDAHKSASEAMKENISSLKSSKELKKHVKDMSEDVQHDFKNDSDSIIDPTRHGNVLGRHVSDENIVDSASDSEYNIDEIDAKIRSLMEQKHKIMRK